MQYIIISVVKNKNKTSKGRHKCKPSYEDMQSKKFVTLTAHRDKGSKKKVQKLWNYTHPS